MKIWGESFHCHEKLNVIKGIVERVGERNRKKA
jgi:hypothetical protein